VQGLDLGQEQGPELSQEQGLEWNQEQGQEQSQDLGQGQRLEQGRVSWLERDQEESQVQGHEQGQVQTQDRGEEFPQGSREWPLFWGETRIQKPETRVQKGGRERNQPNESELAGDERRRMLGNLRLTVGSVTFGQGRVTNPGEAGRDGPASYHRRARPLLGVGFQ